MSRAVLSHAYPSSRSPPARSPDPPSLVLSLPISPPTQQQRSALSTKTTTTRSINRRRWKADCFNASSLPVRSTPGEFRSPSNTSFGGPCLEPLQASTPAAGPSDTRSSGEIGCPGRAGRLAKQALLDQPRLR